MREVRTGQAVREDARFRFYWLIRFASHAVVESFKNDPDHVSFADLHFRPVVADRLTTDYNVTGPGQRQ